MKKGGGKASVDEKTASWSMKQTLRLSSEAATRVAQT